MSVVELGAIVLLRFELVGAARIGRAFGPPLVLAGRPFVQTLAGKGAFLLHCLHRGDLIRQLEPHAVGVKKVNALKDVVISHTDNIDTVCLQTGFHRRQICECGYRKCDVVDPSRRIGRGQRGFVVTKVEKCNVRAITQAKEEMGVGAILAGAGHVITLDDVVQRESQNVFIKVARLFRVFGSIRVVMQALDGRRAGDLGWHG